MAAITTVGTMLAMMGTPVPGVVTSSSRALPSAPATMTAARALPPVPVAFTAPARFALQPPAIPRTLTLAQDARSTQHVPAAGRVDDQRRFSAAGMAMGMTWASPISVVDNDRFDMRAMRIDRVSGSKIKGPLDAGLMLRITASTRAMDANVGLTGGARMLSDALTRR